MIARPGRLDDTGGQVAGHQMCIVSRFGGEMTGKSERAGDDIAVDFISRFRKQRLDYQLGHQRGVGVSCLFKILDSADKTTRLFRRAPSGFMYKVRWGFFFGEKSVGDLHPPGKIS